MPAEPKRSSVVISDDKSTIHHRRPRSIGGDCKNDSNRSKVPQNIHRAWHDMTDNRCARKIADMFCVLLRSGRVRVQAVLKETAIHPHPCRSANRPCVNLACLPPEPTSFATHERYKQYLWRRSKKRTRAWKRLRKLIAEIEGTDESLNAAFAYINKHLIDNDYVLVFWIE